MRAFSLTYHFEIARSLHAALIFRVDGRGSEWYAELSPEASTSGEGIVDHPGLGDPPERNSRRKLTKRGQVNGKGICESCDGDHPFPIKTTQGEREPASPFTAYAFVQAD